MMTSAMTSAMSFTMPASRSMSIPMTGVMSPTTMRGFTVRLSMTGVLIPVRSGFMVAIGGNMLSL